MRERCVCVLFEFRQFVFFTLGTRLHISMFCVDLCKKKSDRTRCLVVSTLEYFEVGRASESVLVF